MLVITMNPGQSSTLYAKDGKRIGEIKVVSVSGNKIRVGFDFSKDEVAIARPGITKEEALYICNDKKNT